MSSTSSSRQRRHGLIDPRFVVLTLAGAALLLAAFAGVVGQWSDGEEWSTAAAATSAAPRAAATVAATGSSERMVDRLVMTDSADTFGRGTLERVKVEASAGEPVRVVLDDPRERAWPRQGDWVSPEVKTDLAFVELLPSWNVQTPADTGARFEVRVRDRASGKWTDWLYIGSWGRTPTDLRRKIESDAARVKIDELSLDRPADAYQLRARLYSYRFDADTLPSLRRVAVCYSGREGDTLLRLANAVEPGRGGGAVVDSTQGDWRRDLPVPFRAQGDSPTPLRGQICSPTSVSMVMAYWGVDRDTVENALAIYDSDYRLFGNWNRAVQRAGELGLDAWLTRFRDWDQVKPHIASGQPLIASIEFGKGEFPSALYPDTDGHLIVIRGFTPEGDVIVNDPASRSKGNGVVYKADELGRAWFGNGGAGYVIRSRDGVPRVAATQPAPKTAMGDARPAIALP